MAHLRTRYEITAHRDGTTYLVGYVGRKSRSGLVAAMQHVGQKMIHRLGITDAPYRFAYKPHIHYVMDGWTIGFTGRTHRDAVFSGEHERV